jgi:hypothetical protein
MTAGLFLLLAACSSWNQVKIADDDYKISIIPIDGYQALKPLLKGNLPDSANTNSLSVPHSTE